MSSPDTAGVNRRVTYKLYPSPVQERALWDCHKLHCDLYNAALQERIDAYRLAGKSIGFAAQCKSLTEIRADHPEYRALHAQSAQVTLKRLDLAFAAFFRRVKAGEEPGDPRFKSYDRFSGFGFKHHGDGFRFTPGPDWRNGKLRLSGIGTMDARGEARTPGQIIRCDIMRKADGWFLSLVIECEPHREHGDLEAGLDWGVETFATIASAPGEYDAFENDRLLNAESDALKTEQRQLSNALRGKRSKRSKKAKKAVAKRHRKVANRRKNRVHQATAKLVRKHKLIVTEDLSIGNMTASAKGTVEKPGKNVKAKAGLNRAILDTAPGSFLNVLCIKAEEAGCQVILLDPRRHRSSQTCPSCASVRKKGLAEREHHCGCGFLATRDQAAALSMLVDGLTRASSSDEKDGLDRQQQLLERYCSRQGWTFDLIADFGSGVNYDKKGLKRLISDMLSGQVGRLVITHKDRLLRFGAELMFAIREAKNVEVVILNQGEDTSFEEDLAEDVREIITIFGARLYASPSRKHQELRDKVKQMVDDPQLAPHPQDRR